MRGNCEAKFCIKDSEFLELVREVLRYSLWNCKGKITLSTKLGTTQQPQSFATLVDHMPPDWLYLIDRSFPS
jgi:hypothetical protein